MAPGQKYLSVRFREKNSNYFNTHNFFPHRIPKLSGVVGNSTAQRNQTYYLEKKPDVPSSSPPKKLLSHLRTNPSLRESSATLIAPHQIGKRCTIPKSDQSSGPVSSSSKQNNQRSRRRGWWLTAIRDPRKP